MAFDDDTSIYVGGLSYEATEDDLRKAFYDYGDIVAAKIICDWDSGNSRGYGFVKFNSPRAAAKAINGMDGGLINGRTIRVNEVKSRNSKPLNRETFSRDRVRDRNVRDFRTRDRFPNSRQFSPPRNRRVSPGAFRITRGRSPAGEQSRSPKGRSLSPSPRDRTNNRNSLSPLSPSPYSDLHHTEEMRSEQEKATTRVAKEYYADFIKAKDDLEKANQSREKLTEKIISLEEEIEQKEKEVGHLRGKSQKFEGTLASCIATSSHQQLQLKKIRRAYLQVRDTREQLKNSETDLQELVEHLIKEDNRGKGSDDGQFKDANENASLLELDWRTEDPDINLDGRSI